MGKLRDLFSRKKKKDKVSVSEPKEKKIEEDIKIINTGLEDPYIPAQLSVDERRRFFTGQQQVDSRARKLYDKPYSFIITKDGDYTVSYNCSTGETARGLNSSTVIQAALGDLTSGRTWKETIKFKGLFSLSTTITISSNTVLDLRDAYLSGTMTSPDYVLTTDSGATNIDIISGIVDGITVTGHAIYFNSTTGCRLLETEVKNASDHNIVLNACTNCEVNAYSHNAGLDGIALTGDTTLCTIDGRYDANGSYGLLITASTNNIISGRYYNNTNYGIRLNFGANNNIFDHPIVDTVTWASGRGIFLDASDTGLGAGGNSRNIFISPIVRNCPNRGIWVYSISGYPNSDNIFISPTVELNDSGIDISTFSTRNQIRGGTVKNNNGYGVFITGTGQKVIGVRAYDDRTPKQQTYGIYVNSDDNHLIIENDVVDNLTANIYVAGTTTTKLRDNIGYVTENSGSDSIASGTTSKAIAHGLSVTPSAEDFTIIGKENPTNDVGTIWVDTIGATNFTVNVENDPGASNWDFGWRVDAG